MGLRRPRPPFKLRLLPLTMLRPSLRYPRKLLMRMFPLGLYHSPSAMRKRRLARSLVTSSSSDKILVPDANIIISGSGATRIVRITPATNRNGSTTITLTVTDGTATTQITFIVTVTPVNDPPTIISTGSSNDA